MPFGWGSSDCALFCADWCKHLTGHDPAAGIRGTYSSMRGAGIVMMVRGGLTSLGDRTNWPKVRGTPQLGDIALVKPVGRAVVLTMLSAPRGAVCTGHQWALKPERGNLILCDLRMFKPLILWRPPC